MSCRAPLPFPRAELERGLRAAAERAAASGMAVSASHSIALGEAPDFAAVFARAEQRREPRVWAAHPQRGFELLGAGAARACALHDAGASALHKATEGWFEPLERHPLAAPPLPGGGLFAFAGLAFEPRPAARRARPWRAFASAAAVLPAFALERRGAAAQLHYTAALLPGTPAEREAQIARALAQFEALAGAGAHAATGSGPCTGAACSDSQAQRSPLAEPGGELAAAHGAREIGSADARRYQTALEQLLAALGRGAVRKVVLARTQRLRIAGALSASASFAALRERHPGCLSYACALGAQTFLGATPERLVELRGLRAASAAVASTAPRGSSLAEREALARAQANSPKEREEHALVVRSIEQALAPFARALEIAPAPQRLETGTLQHLYTPVGAELREPHHVLELVAALHPTAAVGGLPREGALELLSEHEGFDRGWYAGPIGWFDARGQGEFFVALRCALLGRARAQLYAGSGLLASSQAQAEAAETELKLGSAREALRLR